MKKKMAIVLSLILTCSVSMTAAAAPSPSIVKEPVAQVVVNPAISASTNTIAAQAAGIGGGKSAVLPNTVFKTAGGQVVDPSSVAMVVAPATAEQAQAAAASLVSALASAKTKVVNFTGREALSLTDAQGRLNVVNNVTIGLQTASGEAVSQNGSISAAFAVAEILGTTALAEGETIQALYQRADGTWVAVPVVIQNGALAISLPAFGGAVNVTFVVAKGASMESIPPVTSPAT